jgi:transcriptional regulator with XRE-family HTH domain
MIRHMHYDLKYIGEHLKNSRIKAGLSQTSLASLSGVSRATINALENFKAKDVSVNTLSSILNAIARKPLIVFPNIEFMTA